MNNIVVAKFTGEKYINVYDVYQWDYGQILRIEGLKLPKMVEVHFSLEETSGEALVRIGTTKDGVTDVTVPDGMLENEGVTGTYKIYVWVYIRDADSGSTEYKVTIHVKTRSKPEIPGGGDNQDAFNEAVLEVRKSAEKSEEAQKQAEGYAHGREDLPERAEDNAKYYSGKASEDAKKTAEDREAVGRLVESVSGIDEQVVKVEKLSKDAQEAATQAGTSAEQAELHKQAAETASSAAQTAAQETEADRTSVEKTKETVENLSTQVQKNKESVDKTTQDFTLKAQQALADVNNTGQAQTERVQTAGTTAVENIKTAQNTATQAVETAKAEAIKTVVDKGKEVLETIPDFNAKLETKLDKNQGAEHAGKALVVGEDGNVVLGKPQTEGAGDAADAIVNTVRGTLLNVKDSAERKNKGFGMSGKTTQDGTPTPDAPMEIVNAGRLNEDTGKYEVDVKVKGKNLLNEEHFFDIKNWKNNQYNMRLQPNTQYVFSRRDNVGYGSNIFLSIKNTKEDRFSQIINSNSQASNNQSVKFKTKETGLVWFLVQNNSGINLKDMLGYAQIEVGEISTEHELYKEQTITLTSDRPLTKWDRLVEQDGQIGWLYNSSETILNGTEDWIRHSEINKETTQAFGLSISDLIYGEDAAIGQNQLTDKFRYVNAVWAKDEAGQAINNGRLFINIEKTKASTVEEFKAWLKSNNVKVVYKTKQTEFVPLPQSEQDAIRALQTYYPTTVVSNSEDTEMQLTYVADTKNYTDRKIEEAVSAQTQSLANLLSLMPLSTQAAMIEADTNNILDNMEVQK